MTSDIKYKCFLYGLFPLKALFLSLTAFIFIASACGASETNQQRIHSGTTEKMGMPVGQDASNGKLTLPLILAMDGTAETDRRSILQMLDRGIENDVALIRDFVVKNKGVEKSQEKARMFAERAEKILSGFNPSVYRQAWQKLVAHDLERVA